MYRIGVDLGGTNIAVGIVDESYKILVKGSVPTMAQRSPELIVDDMAALCRKLVKDAKLTLKDIISVGIAAPGSVDPETGYVEYANNIPFTHFPVCSLLSERLDGLKVFVENDANAAAWGEAICGAAKGAKDSVMITLGTGVGGGIIIGGKLYSGFNYAGGELGHIGIVVDGKPCSCGRKGCWEAYSSATALIRMTEEKLAEYDKAGKKTVMTDMKAAKGRVTGRTAFDAMRQGDKAGEEVVREYVHYLAYGITNLINIFQPEVLSIGGGISGEGQKLIDMIEPDINAEQYGSEHHDKKTRIEIAKLGNDAGIVGAAVLGM